MNVQHLQFDMPLSNGKFFSLPKHIPGRVNMDDFIFFTIPKDINIEKYVVAVDTLDTSGSSLRVISSLSDQVELPHVHQDAYARVAVIPRTDETLPVFYARLNRGSTYIIPPGLSKDRKIGMKYEMERHGTLTAGSEGAQKISNGRYIHA